MRDSLPGLRRIGLLFETVAIAAALAAALFFLTGQARAAQPIIPAGSRSINEPAAPAMSQSFVFTWTLTAPTAWVHTPVTCKAIVTYSEGLQPATAFCEISTDGGLNWHPGPAVSATYDPASVTAYLTASNIPFPISSADQNRVRFAIMDLNGSFRQVPDPLSGENGFVIRVDNDPPGSPTSFSPSPVGWSNVDGAFAISWINPVDPSGIAKAYFKLDGYPLSNSDYTGSATDPGISSLSGLRVYTPGKHSIAIWLQDGVGNVYFNNRNIALDAFWYDPTPPSSTATASGTPGNNGWLRSPAVVTLSASDPTPGSGTISALHYKVDATSWLTKPLSGPPYSYQFTVTDEDAHGVQHRATDGAGNLSAPQLLQFKIDTVRPSTTYTLAGMLGSGGWYRSPVTVFLAPSDATSGVAGTAYRVDGGSAQSGTQVTVAADGAHQVYFRSTDQAGNQEDELATAIFRIDSRPPVVTATLQPALPPIGWYMGPVTVTLTASDPDGVGSSGLAAIGYRIDSGDWISTTASSVPVAVDSDGLHTVYYRASDAAGNVSPVLWQTVKIDRTPPLMTANWTFDGAVGENGWYRSAGTVTLQAEDPGSGSGVAQIYHRLDDAGQFAAGQSFPVAAEGVHTFAAYAVDAAGNVGATRIYTEALGIDSRPPQVDLAFSALPNAYGWYSTTVVITITASDAMTGAVPSGVQAIEYRQGAGSWLPVGGPLSISSEGQNSYEARARDLAGNVSVARPFTINMDRTAPAAPVAPVHVTPSAWTGSNDFTVTWNNPTDLSGIDRVYYTIDIAPDAPGAVPAGCLEVLSGPTGATGIRVSSEGEHLLFLWLVDKAGNANPHNNRAAPDKLYYDATPPGNARHTIVGTLGCHDYYTGPVQIRLSADDPASGVGAFTWITSTTWFTTPVSGPLNEAVVELSGDDKHTLRYKAIDRAGNRQTKEQSVSLNIDMTPPGAPVIPLVSPVAWSSVPTFTLSWLPPRDFSGIDGIRYTLNRPPSRPSEGLYVASTYASGGRYQAPVIVPGEGSFTVYFWLQDSACNNDPRTAVTRTLRFDATPPVTTMTRDRPPDHDVWYTRPVTLTFTATDGSGSGVARTYYKVNDGLYQIGNQVSLGESGEYSIRFYSTDVAGNLETEKGYQIRVDMTPPTTAMSAPPNSSSRGFTVRWAASDVPNNAIAGYWVQYRNGASGPWQPWQNGTTQTSAIFQAAQRGHFYYFRVRARDEAGNESPWPAEAQAVTFVDPVNNGDFGGGLDGWQMLKDDPAWQASTTGGQCGAAFAALLGSPGYQDGGVPNGAVRLVQAVDLPQVGPGERLFLGFRYRMITYDVKQNSKGELFDTFEADILNCNGGLLRRLVIDGYNKPIDEPFFPARRDLGCRPFGPLDLTQWAGQCIQLRFANWNRGGPDFNTYTYLEDVRIYVMRSINLPLVQIYGQRPQGQAAGEPLGWPPIVVTPIEGALPDPRRQ